MSLPKITRIRMIKITKGKPSNISTNLIIKESIFPPKYPDIAPYERPIVNATKVARNPTSKEILLPYSILEKRSLPSTSVPRMY